MCLLLHMSQTPFTGTFLGLFCIAYLNLTVPVVFISGSYNEIKIN